MAVRVYSLTSRFPSDERYGLTAQIRRAAFSAAANIAEGSAKRGSREFRRFLDISLGSLSEVGYCLLLAREIGILQDPEWKELDDLREEAGRLTWLLYRSMNPRAH